jgi:DNA-binding response OmpR family regulator
MADIKVAIMNTSKELTEILQELLADEGFTISITYTYELKERKEWFDEFIKVNKPDVIVYDIAIPYKENYELFKELCGSPSAKQSAFVLTTTNYHALEKLVGPTNAFEIVGKPFDLHILVEKVNEAYRKINSNKWATWILQ